MEPLGDRPVDKTFDFTQARQLHKREVKYYQTFVDFIKKTSGYRKYNHFLNMKTLNPDQKACMASLKASLDRTAKKQYNIHSTFGRAGTGKTLLLSMLCVEMDMRGIVYQTCAFTGSAAKQHYSHTVFGLLGIYTIHAKATDMINMPVWRTTREKLKEISAIVLDESFLCSAQNFAMMVERINYIKGNKTDKLPCSFYLFGDAGQLPPPFGQLLCAPIRPHFDPLTKKGLQLYQSADYTYELTTVVRQKDDLEFQGILSRILSKTITQADLEKLEARRDLNLSEEERLKFKDVIHLFATNQQCYDFAYSHLMESSTPVRRIDAQFSRACHECELEYKPLYLGVGTKVYLTRNKIVSRGMVNGSEGVVTNIYYSEDNLVTPKFIAVRFEGYTGLTIENFSVPVVLQHENIFCPHHKSLITVSYYPLHPFISRTIHRSQSSTYQYVAINLDFCSSYDKKIYTSLSRAVTLKNIMLTYTQPLKLFFKTFNNDAV